MAVNQKTSRKQRERQRHVQEILDAAQFIFAEKGYDGTRMNDIAEKAEFSVGYLYQIWESKEDLYGSLMESKFMEFKKFVEKRVAETPDPARQIDELIDAHVNFIDENKAFARLYLVETPPNEMRIFKSAGARLKRAHANYLHLVERTFERGVRQGLFVAHRPRDLALALEGVIYAFAKDHLRNSSHSSFIQRGDTMKRIFFHSVLKAPLTAPRKSTKERPR